MLSDILRPEQLMPAAFRQGILLNAEEADLILGYLEGHDYVLLGDGQSRTVRHDLQWGDDHQEDEPYTIQDAIRFALDMNEELLRCAEEAREPDKAYLSSLRKDGRVLASLLDRNSGNLCV